jgi:uncharacterized protein YkwD
MTRLLNYLLIAILLSGSFIPIIHAGYFFDVHTDYPGYEAIAFVKGKNYMVGYEDQFFRPDKVLNRAELLKVAIAAGMFDEDDSVGLANIEEEIIKNDDLIELTNVEKNIEEEDCFIDIPSDAWFSDSVCDAKLQGFIAGYEDSTFRPANHVSVVEAAKIIALTQGLDVQEGGNHWYMPYLKALDERNAFPVSFLYANQEVTRAELAQIIWRLSLDPIKDTDIINSLEKADISSIEGNTCTSFFEDIPDNIDIERVRETWLGWTNEVRAAEGLHTYSYNNQLERTAAIWSAYSKDHGTITHSRPGQTSYYDYWIMKDWFEDLGLTFKQIGRSGFVENIGWNYYSCNEDDCTDEIISAISNTFDFFMSEKGRAYAPHYNSIVNPNYQELGVGLAIDESRKKYYITVHYATEITSNPEPICP